MGAIKTMGIVEELMEIWPNEVCDIVNAFYSIPYSFLRQDAAVTQTTFYGVADLKSLANH